MLIAKAEGKITLRLRDGDRADASNTNLLIYSQKSSIITLSQTQDVQ